MLIFLGKLWRHKQFWITGLTLRSVNRTLELFLAVLLVRAGWLDLILLLLKRHYANGVAPIVDCPKIIDLSQLKGLYLQKMKLFGDKLKQEWSI